MSRVSNLAAGFPSWQQVPFTNVLPSLNSTYFLVDCICWWEKRELMFLKPVKKAIENIFNVPRSNLFYWKLLREFYSLPVMYWEGRSSLYKLHWLLYFLSQVAGQCWFLQPGPPRSAHGLVSQSRSPVLERGLMRRHTQYDGVPNTGVHFHPRLSAELILNCEKGEDLGMRNAAGRGQRQHWRRHREQAHRQKALSEDA